MPQAKPVTNSGGPRVVQAHNFPVQYQPGCPMAKNACAVRRSDTAATALTGREDTRYMNRTVSSIVVTIMCIQPALVRSRYQVPVWCIWNRCPVVPSCLMDAAH